ncbi:MAG: pyridoxal-phosphate dependent enzyme [Paracoccaceae bacterium]
MYIPTFDDVKIARERITPYIHKTPVLTSTFMNDLTGAELFFKCENFQKAGAFKVRGASNAVFGLSDALAVRGVATHSSGKQEVESALIAKAKVFTDEIAQSITIGECQHPIAEGLITKSQITVIGAVINGLHSGRTTDEEITLFDGTGVGLQDLAVATAAVDLAIASGDAIEVDL